MDDAARKANKLVARWFQKQWPASAHDDCDYCRRLAAEIATELRELEAERDAAVQHLHGTLTGAMGNCSTDYTDFSMAVIGAEGWRIRCQEAERELEAEREHFYNLLAVIHRDGGHYQAEHGGRKAGEDAEAIVLALRQENDALATRLARVEVALKKDHAVWHVPYDGGHYFTCVVCQVPLNQKEIRQNWRRNGEIECPPCFDAFNAAALTPDATEKTDG